MTVKMPVCADPLSSTVARRPGHFDQRFRVMITSIHTLIYSDDAAATRAFLRDVLGWKYVAADWDKDWLIFQSGRSEAAAVCRVTRAS